MSKGLQIGLAVVSVFAGLFWLLSERGGGEGTFRYYTSVHDFRTQTNAGAEGAGEGTRVHGYVVSGSIQKDLRAGHVDFRIRDRGGEATQPGSEPGLSVRLDGIDVPDLFRDDAEVVVEGHAQDGRFVARRIFAKCPSKYEAASEAEI